MKKGQREGIVVGKRTRTAKPRKFFISTKEMLSLFQETRPPLIQVDATYHMDRNNYKLVGFCYLDCNTNSTVTAAVGLVDIENYSNFDFLFSELKKLAGDHEGFTLMVDKDFKQIACLEKVFPSSRICLCTFHVIKYMKEVIATACIPVEEREFIFERFRAVVYSHSEEHFLANNQAFKNSLHEVSFKPKGNKEYSSGLDYYTRNWELCAEMWVLYHRRDLITLNDRTNNRIERMFR